jgi:D-amino-acid dehydrogenase
MVENYENEIIIIGAGIIGICAALELKEKGWDVSVIDPNQPGQVTSYGNAGVLSPWSCIPQSVPGLWKSVPKWLLDPKGPLAISWLYAPKFFPWLIKFLKAGEINRVEEISKALLTINEPSVELYKKLVKGTGHEDLIKDSCYLHVYRNAHDASPNSTPWRIRQERGVPLRFLKKGEIKEIEPEISSKIEAAVLIEGQGRTTNPGRLGHILFEKARALGVKFIQQKIERITIESNGLYKLLSSERDILCKNIVLAAGAWSVELLKTIGIKVPLEAERGYHLIFSNPGISVSNSIMDGDRKFVASSMEMGIRSAGTAEFSGLHSKPNFDRAKIFKNLTKELLPNLNTSNLEEWAGIRPSLPDTLPCIGPLPGHPNIIVAFGHSHLGLTQAPMTARIVASIAMKNPLNINLQPFGIERFTL